MMNSAMLIRHWQANNPAGRVVPGPVEMRACGVLRPLLAAFRSRRNPAAAAFPVGAGGATSFTLSKRSVRAPCRLPIAISSMFIAAGASPRAAPRAAARCMFLSLLPVAADVSFVKRSLMQVAKLAT